MSTLNTKIEEIMNNQNGLRQNKVANFAYKNEAYTNNEVTGHEDYNINRGNNIPTAEASVLKVNCTVLSEGYRAQGASITRMLLNHFFGRVSYNLNKVNDFFYSFMNAINGALGASEGIATLDSDAKVPVEQLQNIIDDSESTQDTTYSGAKIEERLSEEYDELVEATNYLGNKLADVETRTTAIEDKIGRYNNKYCHHLTIEAEYNIFSVGKVQAYFNFCLYNNDAREMTMNDVWVQLEQMAELSETTPDKPLAIQGNGYCYRNSDENKMMYHVLEILYCDISTIIQGIRIYKNYFGWQSVKEYYTSSSQLPYYSHSTIKPKMFIEDPDKMFIITAPDVVSDYVENVSGNKID